MLREEAIDLLDNLIGMIEDNHESDYDTALKMAIKALEYDDAKYHEEHGEVIVDKAVWEDAKRALEQEPCTHPDKCHECEKILTCTYYKQEPSGDAVSRTELLKAIDTWDKFGVDDTNSLFRLDNLSLPHYVPYMHYDDVIKCIKGMPSVKPQEPKWDRLYSWLNDMRFGIAPDETVHDDDERSERQAQVDLLDEIMEWMVEPTCDTCEYESATFNPCNACKDKSEYKPKERSDKE